MARMITSDSGQFLTEVVWRDRRSDSHGNAMIDIRDYVYRLQEEMRKIDAFKRELPLCMLLVKDAIERLNQELRLLEKANPAPVLEQFLPLKNEGDEEKEDVIENDNKDKMNWMSSVQLWSSGPQIHHPDTPPNSHKKDVIRSNMMPSPAADLFPLHEKLSESRVRYKGGEDEVPLLSLSTVETKDLKEEMINNYSSGLSSTSRSMASSPAADSKLNSKKRRRCWSPDLHRKFVSVLQQLGGAQVATPKQIRELMQVDGLTNDEVKSHLQKYRVHVRRTDKVSVAKSRGERPCKTSKNGNSPTGSLELARSMTEDYEEEEEEEDVSEINNQ